MIIVKYKSIVISKAQTEFAVSSIFVMGLDVIFSGFEVCFIKTPEGSILGCLKRMLLQILLQPILKS